MVMRIPVIIFMILIVSFQASADVYKYREHNTESYKKDIEILKRKINSRADLNDIEKIVKLSFACEDFETTVKYADMYLARGKSREILYLNIIALANRSDYSGAVKKIQSLLENYSVTDSEKTSLEEKADLYGRYYRSKAEPDCAEKAWEHKSIAGICPREFLLAGFDYSIHKPFYYSQDEGKFINKIGSKIFKGLDFSRVVFFSISPDGREILASVSGSGDSIEVLYRRFSDYSGTWSGWEIPDVFMEGTVNSYACFSPDGRHVFFVSDRDYNNGFEIFYVKRNSKGQWGYPRKLQGINTPRDESSIILCPDGETVYFSSNGREGTGGYDIYYARISRAEKGFRADNIKHISGINTYRNEVSPLFISSSSDRAYFNYFKSNEVSVYQCMVDPMPKPVTTADIYVYDRETEDPLNAEIKIIGSGDEEIVYESRTDKNGYAVFYLIRGREYLITLSAPGYVYDSVRLTIENSRNFITEKYYLAKGRIKEGYMFVADNIYFDSGSASIRDESFSALERLYDFMAKNPGIKVNISGNTDIVGTFDYNMKLSKDRAQSIVEYLMEMGIEVNRMTAEGFGYLKNIAPNTSDRERQMNRRVEIKVISSD